MDEATLRRNKSDIYESGFDDLSLFRLHRLLTLFLLLLTIMSIAHMNVQVVSGASGLGSIHGWVYGINYEDYPVALPSANITARATVFMSTVSRMNGEYQMYLPPGNYSILVSATGYLPYATKLTISNGLTIEINFYLKLGHNP
jgi:hypothetical protein